MSKFLNYNIYLCKMRISYNKVKSQKKKFQSYNHEICFKQRRYFEITQYEKTSVNMKAISQSKH